VKTVIEGKWIFDGKQVVGDAECNQIEALLPTLTLVGSRDGGWTRLYRGAVAGVYWQLTYPQSDMHGGGPPRLESYSVDEVRLNYPDLELPA
jgi:hypothetical protein